MEVEGSTVLVNSEAMGLKVEKVEGKNSRKTFTSTRWTFNLQMHLTNIQPSLTFRFSFFLSFFFTSCGGFFVCLIFFI